jgi:heme-degrading monooxygenase HmoA
MTAFGIVRFRGKPGSDKAVVDRLRTVAATTPEPEGFRKNTTVQIGPQLYCGIIEWDSFEALANARLSSRIFLDGFRDLLADLGDVGVTFAVSGEAICEFARPDDPPRDVRQDGPRAWNILRFHLESKDGDAMEKLLRAASPPLRDSRASGLRRMALVKVGDRAFCVLGEWDNPDDLADGGPLMIQRYEMVRDSLRAVTGGLGVIQATGGPVVFEFERRSWRSTLAR